MTSINNLSLKDLIDKYDFVKGFLEDSNLDITGFENLTFKEYLAHFSELEIEEKALDIAKLENDLFIYIENMKAFLGLNDDDSVESLTILAGQNKKGESESFGEFTINKSEMVAIVGPTGSGKSRLLADIEWTANRDTPTKRAILINGKTPDTKWRFSSNNKLVAQLSQNMNFVMDLSVKEFLELHAQSRMVENVNASVAEIIKSANHLAGETFSLDTAITALSGGQSRALMIADTAILSSSPIVLIDEIENAGIDREKALSLLVSKDKIVLMATHDPSLALMADKRIVISGGGISKIIKTTSAEKERLAELASYDKRIKEMINQLRYGETIV